MSDHYAHLDLAKGLMYDSKRFRPETVGLFFKRLQDRAESARNLDTVLISAEPFHRGKMPGESPYWRNRERYIAKLKESVPFGDVEIVLVLRRQDDYLESLYNEHVKTTRYTKHIWSFLDDYHSRFEYAKQIRLWAEYFPTLKVYLFEDFVKSGSIVRAFLTEVLGLGDMALGDLTTAASNVSLR
jgi:hypothetical protein